MCVFPKCKSRNGGPCISAEPGREAYLAASAASKTDSERPKEHGLKGRSRRRGRERRAAPVHLVKTGWLRRYVTIAMQRTT